MEITWKKLKDYRVKKLYNSEKTIRYWEIFLHLQKIFWENKIPIDGKLWISYIWTLLKIFLVFDQCCIPTQCICLHRVHLIKELKRIGIVRTIVEIPTKCIRLCIISSSTFASSFPLLTFNILFSSSIKHKIIGHITYVSLLWCTLWIIIEIK